MPGSLDHETQVADRAEPVVVRPRPVVVHGDARARSAQRANAGALRAFVTTCTSSISATSPMPVDDPVDDRAAADRAAAPSAQVSVSGRSRVA